MADNAQSFIKDIVTTHGKVLKSQETALQHAISCGEFLVLAEENVKAAEGKFTEWPKAQCNIPQSTAFLYMRLAKGKAILEDDQYADRIAELKGEKGYLSMRDGDTLISEVNRTPDKQKELDKKAKERKAQKVKDKQVLKDYKSGKTPSAPSVPLEKRLEPLAPDEVVTVLKQANFDDEKLTELSNLLPPPELKTVLGEADPDDVVEAITQKFEGEDLRQIVFKLSAYLRKSDPQEFAALNIGLASAQDLNASH